jgi:hypothetical protein
LTIVGRRRAVAGVLVALAAWPVFHGALVARYEVDPWKLFGWAMYAVPPIVETDVSVFEKLAPGWRPLHPGRLDEDERAALSLFLARHRALGVLAKPEAFARAYLSRRPEVSALALEVALTTLDRESARLALRPRRFVYER